MSADPRTNAGIVRDLLAIVKDRAWQAKAVYRGGGEWITGCEDCGADIENDSTDTHRKGCSTAAPITEAEAFLRVEETLEEERERAAEDQAAAPPPWPPGRERDRLVRNAREALDHACDTGNEGEERAARATLASLGVDEAGDDLQPVEVTS